MIPIITHPGYPVLRRVAARVERFDGDTDRVIAMMIESMYASSGVGLAAPQVNVSQRIAVIDHSGGDDANQMTVMINPDVIWRSAETASGAEGCLSLPGVMLDVVRHVAVDVEYSSVDGVRRVERLAGIRARIAQHEIDHLDGILMIDRVSSLVRRLSLKGYDR